MLLAVVSEFFLDLLPALLVAVEAHASSSLGDVPLGAK